jgi:hypothetical protein
MVGLATTETVSVTSQRVSVVQFDETVVRVFGRVTFGGRAPASRPSLLFYGRGSPTTVLVHADGSFEARLGLPGTYTIRFASGPLLLLGAERQFAAVAGYNRVDWELPRGSLSISIRGWDRSSPVDVRLKVVAGPQAGGFTDGRLTTDVALPYLFEGLALTSYSIEASQRPLSGPAKSSRRELVKLEADRSRAEVTLNLESYGSTVVLRNTAGAPVRSAVVAGQLEGHAVEIEPGVYRLDAEVGRAGDEVSIAAPGYTPECRLAPPDGGRIELTMTPGVPARVRYLGVRAMSRPEGEIMWPGTECWVSLRHFAARKLDGPTEFLLQNSPRGGPSLFRLGQATSPVGVADDGFLIFKWPAK